MSRRGQNGRTRERRGAFGRRWAFGQRRAALAVVALAAALALGVGGLPAWADNPTNEAVPTDDTGVVDPSAGKDDGAAGAQGAGGNAGADGNAGAPDAASVPPEGALTLGAPNGEGAEAASGADGETAADAESPAPAAPRIPDPVFGDTISEDNRVNPQQKPDSSFIYDTSISALQEADSYLNNQTVQVTGEVVGDRIKAEFDPGFCWIVLQANDDSYAEVPVFLSLGDTEPIDTYGSYGRKGTTLQIRGIFHLSCSDHQGLTDLHADTVTVVEKGSVTEQVLDPHAFLPGGVLVVVGLVMVFVFRHMREGRR